jgi:hypothetical protein
MMGLTSIVLGIVALGGCALIGAALVGVAWVIVNERRSRADRP